MNEGDDFPDIQDVIDEYVHLINLELQERGALYEKYGSGIRDSLKPLRDLVSQARDRAPFSTYEFLKEFFK